MSKEAIEHKIESLSEDQEAIEIAGLLKDVEDPLELAYTALAKLRENGLPTYIETLHPPSDNLVYLGEYRSTKQTEDPPTQTETTEPAESKLYLSPEQLDLFNTIYKEYAPNIKKFVRSIAGSDAIAEEITQEAFIKIFRNLDRFEDREGGSLRAWVYRVARNTSFNYTRQARAHPTSPSDKLDYMAEDTPGLVRVVATGGSTEDAADTAENREEVFEKLEILDEIAPQYKEALILAANDFTYVEIAEIMGRTVPAVKSVLVRARQSLRDAYEKRQEIDFSVFDIDETEIDEKAETEILAEE